MSNSATTLPNDSLTMRRVTQTWWPLAAGWFLMTVEIPVLSAAIARNPEPQINLAAWGLVFSLALILASPVMMLLSASTALSRDWQAYTKVLRYGMVLSLILTLVHMLLAFTPLFDFVVGKLMAPPPEIIEPTRLGLALMLPYIAALAYRRFNYGVLIRFNHTRSVTLGAGVRLATDALILVILYLIGVRNGVVIATITITIGVVVEAIYSGVRVHPVLNELRAAKPSQRPLTLSSFLEFYTPLVMTSLLQILVQPMGTAALSRMAEPLDSLAVWPVVYSLMILWTSAGMAFTDAVVVLLDEPRPVHVLHKFTLRGGIIAIGLLLIMNATPLADLWFKHIAALPPELAGPASWALWMTLLVPGLAFLQSWYTGTLVNARQTRGITEAVFVALLVNGLVLWLGVVSGQVPGLYVGTVGLVAGHFARTIWLWVRTRPTMRSRRAQETPSLSPART